jgi:hypothetical protein
MALYAGYSFDYLGCLIAKRQVYPYLGLLIESNVLILCSSLGHE